MSIATDDEFINKVLPYVFQSYNILCRQVGHEINITTLECVYILGIQFWKAYLEKYEINTVVFFNYPHEGNDFLVYQVCKIFRVDTYIFATSIISERDFMVKSVEDVMPQLLDEFTKLKQQNLSEENIVLDDNYQMFYDKMSQPQTDKTPYYMKKRHMTEVYFSDLLYFFAECDYKLTHKKNGANIEMSLSEKIRGHLYKIVKLDLKLTGGAIIQRALAIVSRRHRETVKLLNHYEKLSVPADLSQKYIYYPMHFQPECTSNPQGGIYYKQSIPIRLLAESLPENSYIYVKEHPAQIYGAREKEDYDELLSIPNVVLVDRFTDTYELIKHSQAVASLAGTAGWEGIFW